VEYLKNIISSKKKRIKKLKRYSGGKINEMDHQDRPAYKKKSKNHKKLSENIDSSRVNIIAEIKKASPSKGLINEFADIKDIALLYDKYKRLIRGISVVTEETYFQGNIEYIGEVKKITRIPVLQKDFIFHESQVYEGAGVGADCILLISSILGRRKLEKLYRLSLDLGMEAIVEVHSIEDLIKTMDIDAKIIGINNRDLKNMKIDRENVFKVYDFAKKSGIEDRIFISESGIGSKNIKSEIACIKRLFDQGISTFLIGTYFMESMDLDLTLKELQSMLSDNGLI
jgi:indole-3-glycerol phosphate synthase